jgi:hypothetical protein
MLVGDPVLIVVSREEVEARDTSSIMRILRSCLVSTERMLGFAQLRLIIFGSIASQRGRSSNRYAKSGDLTKLSTTEWAL